MYRLLRRLVIAPWKLQRSLPRKLVLIIAATAPNLASAYRVTTISGELVVKTPTKSPAVTPRACSRAANRSTTVAPMVSYGILENT